MFFQPVVAVVRRDLNTFYMLIIVMNFIFQVRVNSPMSTVFVRSSNILIQLVFLVLLSMSVGHSGSATCQPRGKGASAEPTAVPEIGTKRASRDATASRSKKGSFIFGEVEPLLLLLFGAVLFSVATVIKLKLSRLNQASGQYFEPLVSQSAGRSETNS